MSQSIIDQHWTQPRSFSVLLKGGLLSGGTPLLGEGAPNGEALWCDGTPHVGTIGALLCEGSFTGEVSEALLGEESLQATAEQSGMTIRRAALSASHTIELYRQIASCRTVVPGDKAPTIGDWRLPSCLSIYCLPTAVALAYMHINLQ